MFTEESLGQYIVKQVIVEVRHTMNLLFKQEARHKFNNLMSDFDVVNIVDNDDSFEFVNVKKFLRLFAFPDRFVMTVENSDSIDSVEQLLRKYISAIASDSGKKSFKRFGTRVIYLFPFSQSFESLVNDYKDIFYNKSCNPFSPLGSVKDVGVIGLTMEDTNYKMNLSVGPFTHDEIKQKISYFKNYNDEINNSLMLDLDLYQLDRKECSLSSCLHEALDQSRIKAVKFRDNLI
jgi:hypothetical protein